MNLKGLKPRHSRYDIGLKERGLYARVSPSGEITVLYKYSVDNDPKRLKLGKFPDLSEREIRKEYEKARGDVARGLDPAFERQKATQTRREEQRRQRAVVTVSIAAERWLRDIHHTLAKATLSGYRSCMKCHVSKSAIWDMPIRDVTYFDLVKIADDIHKNGTPAAAGNVKRAISNLFNWSRRAGYLEYSVAVHVSPTYSDDREHNELPERDRVLSDEEIRDIWDAMGNDPYGAPAKLVLLTGCRRKEISGMHCDEIHGDWWTIPKIRIKTRRKKKQDFRVYVTPTTRSLLRESQGFMFPSRKGGRKPIDPGRMTKAFTKATTSLGLPPGDQPGGAWLYDCRRTLRTRIEEQFAETMPYIGGLLLNHNRGKIDGIYNRYAYDEQKKKALLWWDEELNRILNGGDVIKFPVRKV